MYIWRDYRVGGIKWERNCKNAIVTFILTLKFTPEKHYSFAMSAIVCKNGKIVCEGQCKDDLVKNDPEKFGPGGKFHYLIDLWDKWHMNDLRPGVPEQMKWLNEHFTEYKDKFIQNHPKDADIDNYHLALAALDSVGLKTVNGCTYGDKRYYEPLPRKVLNYIKDFINAGTHFDPTIAY